MFVVFDAPLVGHAVTSDALCFRVIGVNRGLHSESDHECNRVYRTLRFLLSSDRIMLHSSDENRRLYSRQVEMPLGRRQWWIDRYIANAENDIPFSAIRQCNINRGAVLQKSNTTNRQFRAPLDRSQLRLCSVTASIATVSDEYWSSCVDTDDVSAVIPHLPKPKEREKGADDHQRRGGSRDKRKRVFGTDCHDLLISVALIAPSRKVTVVNRRLHQLS